VLAFFFFHLPLLSSLLFNQADHDYRVAAHKEVPQRYGNNVFEKKLYTFQMSRISFRTWSRSQEQNANE